MIAKARLLTPTDVFAAPHPSATLSRIVQTSDFSSIIAETEDDGPSPLSPHSTVRIHRMTSSTDLAELLCSRLCHDMLSPVGALSNGLELLRD
jgi:hypothetical protein